MTKFLSKFFQAGDFSLFFDPLSDPTLESYAHSKFSVFNTTSYDKENIPSNKTNFAFYTANSTNGITCR